MKTQILQLEPYDDIVSARDKMGWGKTQRILLVWPPRGRVLNRRLDLLMLLRHSRKLGAQLALVADDQDVIFYAADLGIPVFETTEVAQDQRWRRGRSSRLPFLPAQQSPLGDANGRTTARERLDSLREQARPRSPTWAKQPVVRMLLFACGVLAVLILAAVLLPSATITLEPEIRIQEVTFTAEASEALETINLSGVIPAREITVVVEGRETTPSTASVRIPNTPATGSVRFTNLTNEAVAIPKGTQVLAQASEPVRFATTRSGTLRAGTGENLSLPVEAITRGSAGNLGADQIDSVEGPLGLQVTVTNPLATHGGSDFDTPGPSSADRRRLERQLIGSLEKTALAEIVNNLGDGDILISAEPQLVEVIAKTYTPEGAQPAEQLELLLRLKYAARIVAAKDLEQLAVLILDASLEGDFKPDPDSLELSPLGKPVVVAEGVARWEMSAERMVIAELRGIQAVNLSLGLSPDEAAERLIEGLNLKTIPEIELTPPWWPRLPILPFRIQVEQEII